LRTWAWEETSRPETISSARMKSGRARWPGDADALALAAGELVRVAVAEAAREADLIERLVHRASTSAWPWSASGPPMSVRTRWRGLREDIGSWKII
jgi:hypothetical protein